MRTTEVVDQVVKQVVDENEKGEGGDLQNGAKWRIICTHSKVDDNFPSILLHAHGRGH